MHYVKKDTPDIVSGSKSSQVSNVKIEENIHIELFQVF